MTIRRIKEKNPTLSPAKSLQSSAYYTSLAAGSLTSIPGCAQKYYASSHCCTETSRVSCNSVQPRLLLHFFLILLHLVAGAFSIKVQEMRVPHPGVVERPATLECVYDTGLDKDSFYSIRWYLKGELFYSFIKGNNPEKINHNHTDVDVAMDHSDTRKVTLREITAAAEGQYRCEVMGEAPFFETDSTTQNLTVVRLPDSPEFRVTRSSYRVGETVEATCTARHSWPPSTLSFSVNGQPIPAESSRVRNIGVSEDKSRFYFPKGSFTSTSILILPIERRLSSSIRLGCHALVQSLEKASFISVEVESGLSSMFSFFNAGGVDVTSGHSDLSARTEIPPSKSRMNSAEELLAADNFLPIINFEFSYPEGAACWTSDVVLIAMTLATLLLLQRQL